MSAGGVRLNVVWLVSFAPHQSNLYVIENTFDANAKISGMHRLPSGFWHPSTINQTADGGDNAHTIVPFFRRSGFGVWISSFD
jgi:hypothetical protein